jgi:hypothetical protein
MLLSAGTVCKEGAPKTNNMITISHADHVNTTPRKLEEDEN